MLLFLEQALRATSAFKQKACLERPSALQPLVLSASFVPCFLRENGVGGTRLANLAPSIEDQGALKRSDLR